MRSLVCRYDGPSLIGGLGHVWVCDCVGPKLRCAPQGTVSDGFDGSGQTQVLYTSSERKENDFEARLAHHYRYIISLGLGK